MKNEKRDDAASQRMNAHEKRSSLFDGRKRNITRKKTQPYKEQCLVKRRECLSENPSATGVEPN